MALPGGASATTPAGSATCSKVSLKVSGTAANLSLTGCTDTANTGGSGTIKATTLLSTKPETVVISWASKGTTTTVLTIKKGGKLCPSADTEYSATGTVKSDTGKAKSIKVKGTVSTQLCAKGTAVSLAPKTLFKV